MVLHPYHFHSLLLRSNISKGIVECVYHRIFVGSPSEFFVCFVHCILEGPLRHCGFGMSVKAKSGLLIADQM